MKWWRYVAAMELRKILAYRSDFWITFLGQTFIQVIIAHSLWSSIFSSQHTSEMNGFTLDMMTLYYVLVAVGMKVISGENIGFLSREIYDGTFTRYLIYPLSFFQYKLTTYLTHSFFYSIQLILVYMLYRLFYMNTAIELHEIGPFIMGVGLFFLGAITFFMIATFIELLALWADNIWSLMVMLRFFASFLGGGFIPLSFFPPIVQELVKYTPFPYFISLPVRTIMGLSQSTELFLGSGVLILWTLFLYGCIQMLWKKGEKHYNGVGI